jgi:hypothetical protein
MTSSVSIEDPTVNLKKKEDTNNTWEEELCQAKEEQR